MTKPTTSLPFNLKDRVVIVRDEPGHSNPDMGRVGDVGTILACVQQQHPARGGVYEVAVDDKPRPSSCFDGWVYYGDQLQALVPEAAVTPTPTDAVNHPAHYGGGNNPYEAIKVIEAWNLDFCLGNAVKYISRAGKKTVSPREDLEKAVWYLQRRLKQVTEAEITPRQKHLK